MSRERRQAMQSYILGIKDPEKRAAAELHLARYKGFAIGVDGRLGFGTEEGAYGEGVREGETVGGDSSAAGERRQGRSLRESVKGCGVM